MKIVAHNGATIWGGAERATTRLLAGLAQRGHEVLLLCNSPVVEANARDNGVPAAHLPVGGDLEIHHAFRLQRKLQEIQPDAFIVGTYKKLFLATLGASRAGVPKIVARIGLQSDTPRSWKYRFALRKWTDAVVVNSTMIEKSFRAAGVPRERIKVIPNGVSALARVLDVHTARKQLGLPENAFVIGTAARLAIQKRIDRLVEAVALLPAEVHCVVAGDGTRRGDIEALIRDKGLEHRFHLLGHSDNVSAVLSALDVYVVSSDSEGLSNSMLEAMTLGVPVVSTDVSGATDALVGGNDSEPGGVIVSRDAAAIASGVRRMLTDAAMRERMGRCARERATRLFSTKRMIDEWETFLSSPS